MKPTHRAPQLVGPSIETVKTAAPLAALVDGAGLADRDADRLTELSTQKDQMWLAPVADAAGGIEFDLGEACQLGSLQIWNYNEPGYTKLGVAQVDVSVWTEGGGWKTVLRQAEFSQAEGTDDYDEPVLLTFAPVQASKVRLENLKPFAEEGYVGLGAVRFYGPVGLAACNPEPKPETQIGSTEKIHLTWTPGKDAVAHDIYAGPEGSDLTLLGRIADTQADMGGLVGDRTYRWRIDEIRADGAVTAGPEWTFTLDQGQDAAAAAANAAPTLMLVGATLLEPQTDLKAVAEAQQTQPEETAKAAAPRRNLLPVLVIVVAMIAAAVLLRPKSA